MSQTTSCGNSATKNLGMDASGSSALQPTSLITKASGGDLPRQRCTRGVALREQRLVNQASGHGWQYWASSVLDSHFRKNLMLTNRPDSRQAHFRSHSGRNAGFAFAHAPTTAEYAIPPDLFRVLLLERLQLPPAVDGSHLLWVP